MDLIIFDKVSYKIGENEIIRDMSFTITDNTRIALVGRNGTGKSTLLKLIADEIQPTSGNIYRKKNLRIGYLHQEQRLIGEIPLKDAVLQQNKLWWKYYTKLADTSLSPDEHDRIMTKFLSLGGYSLTRKCEEILGKFGFDTESKNQIVDTLSGGERNRAAITAVLLSEPDIMLFDEPTNHIDYDGLKWLAQFLKNTKKPFILVSHDRYFLDLASERFAEIIGRKLNVFKGNYANFLEHHRQLIESRNKKYYRQRELISRTEEFIRQNIAGQKTKQAQSRRKMLGKMNKVDISQIDDSKNFRIDMNIDRRGGNKVLKIVNLKHYFDEVKIFENFSTVVGRGDKIGVVGPNGCGKTTLMKLISGHLPIQDGEIELGAGITIAYFSQTYADIPDVGTPYSVISNSAPYLTDEQVRAHLGAFSISAADAFRPMKSFSGGERSRIAIARLVLSNANLLILDEPTNHLDILSRQTLENALANYQGTAIVVSHDRYFLDVFTNIIWAFENHIINRYIGNFSDYLSKRNRQEKSVKNMQKSKPAREQNRKNSAVSKNKIENLKKKLGKLESRIEKLELEQQKLLQLLGQSFVTQNYDRYSKVADNLKRIELELNVLWDEWEQISTEPFGSF
ncbi:ABC-F family ATP-binding cassette domain-containing protein [bacterium]|nr:ABC-F family ATP-binding cassette domain-containing protein [bacterium]